MARDATLRKFRTVQTEGNREVSRNVDFYKPDDTHPLCLLRDLLSVDDPVTPVGDSYAA
jgi:hypothetical protein